MALVVLEAQAECRCYIDVIVTISISAGAYQAITGLLPEPSERDNRGGYPLLIDHKTMDQLKAARGPMESYSDVIVRLAKSDGGEE
jgi:hypothetical protein